MQRPHVLIVGAGFGGITAAKALAPAPVEVTLVDRRNFHTFSPLLYQVATAALAPEDIAPNTRGILQPYPNVEARMATVVGVDFDRREVLVDTGPSIPYDFLVLAAGAVSSDFGVPGVAEHALPLKTLADATRIRSTVLRRFEEANARQGGGSDGAVTLVVAGGGPTGVELAGALAELISKVLAKDFKRLDVGRARVVLVEMSDRLLGGFSAPSGAEAKRELEQRGVEVRLGTSIASVGPDAVTLGDGTVIRADAVIWAAGVKANPLADVLGLAQSPRGEIVVGPDLSVGGRPEVFVIGDLSAAPKISEGRTGWPRLRRRPSAVSKISEGRTGWPRLRRRPSAAPHDRHGEMLPQLAPVAMQGGRYVAKSIAARLAGGRVKPFRYVDKGTMATIGRRSAVAELPLGIRFGGTLGWLSWLGLHLVFLIGFRHRVVVLVNWAWNYVKWDRGNRLILADPDE